MTHEKYILVCGLVAGPLLISDNLTGRCDTCDRLVQFRSHAPPNRILRCLNCAMDQIGPDDTVEVPPRMWEDARTYFRRKLQ